jgi:hypothetical protein
MHRRVVRAGYAVVPVLFALAVASGAQLPLASCTKREVARPTLPLADRCALLDLRGAGIDDVSIRTVAIFLCEHKQVRMLDISGNSVTSEGMSAAMTTILAADGSTAPLRALILARNSESTKMGFGPRRFLGDSGAIAVAKALSVHFAGDSPSLLHVDLSDSAIGDEGAIALAAALHSPRATLTKLNLARNKIGVVGARALEATLSEGGAERNTNLRFVELGANTPSDDGDDAIDDALLERIESLLQRNDRWRCVAAPSSHGVDPIAMEACAGARDGGRCPLACIAGFAPGGVTLPPETPATERPYLLCKRGAWAAQAVQPGGSAGVGLACEALRCSASPLVEHAAFVASSQSAVAQRAVQARCAGLGSGRHCPVACDDGYALKSGETTAVLTCEGGRWSGEAKCARSWLKVRLHIFLCAHFFSSRHAGSYLFFCSTPRSPSKPPSPAAARRRATPPQTRVAGSRERAAPRLALRVALRLTAPRGRTRARALPRARPRSSRSSS